MRVTFSARSGFFLFLVGTIGLAETRTVWAWQSDDPPAAAAAEPGVVSEAEAAARESFEEELDEELERQRAIAERFLVVLDRNPRRGTALDKIYAFHLEAGTLEKFAERLRADAEQANDGARWMILGLLESQRGRDAAAIEALKKATEQRPEDALAPFYLGQAQALVGQPEEAIVSFEQAIARKPAPTDSLEIFQALGRALQRAHRTDEALAVWKRLEESFPGDVRVQERIAVALAEEGQLAAALPRYEALAKASDDDYRRVVFQMEAAELKVKLDRAAEGIADLEQALASLNPESWLFREVRRKIEDVFLKTEDREGLAKYYESWLEKHPDDVDAMARLAKSLASQGRIPEARERLDQALKLAPSRQDLRLTFIAQLVEGKNFPAALEQYQKLDELDPGNPDHLRAWGKLHLRDDSRPQLEREQSASAIWRRIVDARPADPLLAAQTADLFRQADVKQEALALYEKAVELAPAAPQYREYLGEYLHILERREEAVAVWRAIADGDHRTAENLARLAEVLAKFGYLPEALPEIASACELDPKNFALHLSAADLRSRAEAFDDALGSLDAAEALAQNDEEREVVLVRRIRTLQSADRLENVTSELETSIADGSTAEDWFLLARYREALRLLPEATSAIEQALAKQPDDIRSLDAAARIAESSGELEKAADLNRKLVTVDRRGRTTYLERIASLESQLGRIDAALAAGRDLIAFAPGNVDAYQFFADLCTRLDRPDEGIEALRRAARVNPHEPNLLLSLAAALADRFRTDEAIEIYWQAYDKSGSLDDRLLVIGKQADLYLQTNRFDQFLERLERGRSEPETRREATICLAQAYHSAGDYGMARQELESLLGEDSRDTQLLQQLSKLAESESDFAGAIGFQERLAEVAPGPETEYRLATLLGQSGDDERSSEILFRLSIAEEDQAKLLRNVDRLLSTQKTATALRIVQTKLQENPLDWELLTREGVALFRLERDEEAAEAFRKILSLSLPSDEKGAIASPSTSVYSASQTTPSSPVYQEFALEESELNRLSRELGLDPRYGVNYGYSPMQQFPAPTRFGAARSSALAWSYLILRKQGKEQEFSTSLRDRAESETASEEELIDWYRLRVCTGDQAGIREAARLLVDRGLARGRIAYLQRLRVASAGQTTVRAGAAAPTLPPLPNEDLELALECYAALDAADGDASPPAYVTTSLIAELDRAGRTDEADDLLASLSESTTSAAEAAIVLSVAASRKETEDVRKYFDRFAHLDLEARRAKSSNRYSASGVADSLAPQSLELDEALDLFDAYLDWQSASTAIERERSRRRASAATSMTTFNYQYWSNGVRNMRANETMLVPFDRFDSSSIVALRNVFERCKEEDRIEDFEARLAKIADDPAAATRDVRLYARAYVARWNGDESGTAEAIRRCAEMDPQDFDLQMIAARYHAGVGDLDEALAMIDGVSPTDQRSTQERETLALDLAVRLGDRERATTAARRLFGLRLPSETQVALASQMRRLGLNDEADAALSRAQRQAGGRIPALAALMGQYRAQGDDDVAVEVAYRILQRSRPAKSSSSSSVAQNSDEAHRLAALQCLLATGELDKAIAAIEEQIARTPQAAQLYERLAEYVRAKGDGDKEIELLKKLCELNPKDAIVRADLARRATSRGKHSEACDAYLAALAIDPSVMERDYYQIPQMFQQAQRLPDLAKAFEKLDLTKIRQPYYVVNMVETFMRSETTRPAGIALLKRAAKEMPDYRSYLWRSLDSAQALQDPELLDLAVESVIFTDATAGADPWSPLAGSVGYSGEGRIRLGLESLIDALRKTNRAEDLIRRLDEALAKRPEWMGGKALKLWIEFPDLDPETATARVNELLGDRKPPFERSEFYARWGLAQLLATKPELKSVAVEMLAASGDEPSMQEFSYTPRAAAYRLYKELGRDAEAIAILKTAIPERLPAPGSEPYERVRMASQLIDLGQTLSQAGESIEAVRAYSRLLSEPSLVAPEVGRAYTSDPEYFRSSATQGLEAAIAAASAKGIEGEDFASLFESGISDAGSLGLPLLERAAKGDQPPQLYSPILELLSRVSPEEATTLEETLTRLATERPDDYGVALVATIASLRDLDDPRASEALARLVESTKAEPLSPIEAGRRASAKQRSEATPQVGLWLVARQAYEKPELRDAANVLADRSVEAAARLTEPRYLNAILLERGTLAYDAGDVAGAEAIWSDLLDRLFPPRKATGSGEAALVPPATMSQFTTAASLAVLAGDRGSRRISFDAIRRALAGGLPVPDMQPQAALSGGVVMSVSRSQLQPQEDPALKLVGESVRNASFAWRRGNVPAEEASLVLEAVVFPASRPREILFLSSDRDILRYPPQSVAGELAVWAAAAGRNAEIAKAVAARHETPETEAAGLALLALVAIELDDAKLLEERLKGLDVLWDRLSPHTRSAAAHAPIAALAHPKFEKIAGTLAEKVALGTAEAKADGRSSSSTSTGAGDLSRKLVALRARSGDAAAALDLAEKFLEFRRREFLRYGDYGYTLVRNELAGFAAAIASAGDPEATLAAIGRIVDTPPSQQNAGVLGGEAANATDLLLTQLMALQPSRRYELLRDWTLPSAERKAIPGVTLHVAERKTLRSVTLMQPSSQLPAEFRSKEAPAPTLTSYGILSTFAWLVEAARDAGTLDELRGTVQPLTEQKLADADLLLLLIDIESDADAANAKLAALIEDSKKRPDERPQDESPEQARSLERQRLEALAAVTAMENPVLVDAATTLLEDLVPEYERRNNDELKMLASKRLARRYAQRAGGDPETIFKSPGLDYWHAESGSGIASGPQAPIFVAHDGVIAHLAGDGLDRLFFKYPLGGEFRVSFESTVGWSKQAELGFGGTVCEPRPWEKCVYVYDATHRESIRRPEIPSLWEQGWDRTEVHVSPESVRWFVHGQLAFEDRDPAPTSPWLYLAVGGGRSTRIREVRIEGDPQILREVPLIVGSSLDGWQSFDGMSLTNRLSAAEATRLAAEGQATSATQPSRPVQRTGEWSAVDGALTSFPTAQRTPYVTNGLTYFRPLQAGEALSYEFFYEPDVAVVHPTIGMTAYELREEGVTLRLASLGTTATANGYSWSVTEEASADAFRQGPERLPLRPGEWNRAEVRMEQGRFKFVLNDEVILERPLTLEEDRRFGFFRLGQNDEVRVRNVVLRGDWPETFPQQALDDALAFGEDASPQVRLARHAAIEENLYLDGAYEVWRRAQAMSPASRYEYLRKWVLPNADHPTLRTVVTKSPLDPPALEGLSSLDAPQPTAGVVASRIHRGGDAASPALKLVRTAKEVGRLEKLETDVAGLAASADPAIDQRAVTAMLVAIDAALGRFDSAKARMKTLRDSAANVPPEREIAQRGPDTLALFAALEHPETLEDARTTAAWLVEKADAPGTSGEWVQFIRREWGIALATNDPASGGAGESAPATLLHWWPVALPTALTRGDGRPASKWRVTEGRQVEYLGGNADDALYFSTPLSGDFDVVCEMTDGDYREMRLFYDGASMFLQRGGASIGYAPHGRGVRDVPTPEKLTTGEWVDMRLCARGEELILFVDGKEALRTPRNATTDPWFAIMTKLAFTHGAVRNFRIEGTPAIPREVELFAGSDLVGGAAVYYGESVGGDSATWRRIDGELRAARLANAPDRSAESLLQYHRPMLEDGEIEYEFYWTPGETEVHPALDRFVFVLQPDGVAAHAMTDGAWERNDADPAEIVPLPDAVPVPLKADEWNKAKLVLQGDVATLFVNDQQVAVRTLPPTNQRTFGLFRWADRSGVRVRNVVHRGDWPTELPPAEERSFILSPAP